MNAPLPTAPSSRAPLAAGPLGLVAEARAAFADALSPALRPLLWRSLAASLVLLALLMTLMFRLAAGWAAGLDPWVALSLEALAGLALVFLAAYLVAPVSILVAGFFADDIALKVERAAFPLDPPGRALGWGEGAVIGLRFGLLAAGANLLALVLLLIPGVNLVAFFAANAYVLGRQYFELAAARFRTPTEAAAMRRRHGGAVLAAGAIIAGVTAVPVLNLLSPLFGTALMVRVHKRLEAREERAG